MTVKVVKGPKKIGYPEMNRYNRKDEDIRYLDLDQDFFVPLPNVAIKIAEGIKVV